MSESEANKKNQTVSYEQFVDMVGTKLEPKISNTIDYRINERMQGNQFAGGYYTNVRGYAEKFKWEDNNSRGEDREGYVVTTNKNGDIRIAVDGDPVLGVVVSDAAFVGNNAINDTEMLNEQSLSGKEWATVCLVGTTKAYKGQPSGPGWIKIKDIDDENCVLLVK